MNGQHSAVDAEAAVATPRPTLTLGQRNQIWEAVQNYARAERAHQRAMDNGLVGLTEVGQLDLKSHGLTEVLNRYTSTEVNYDLLERTLERDDLIGLRDRLTEQVERLMRDKTEALDNNVLLVGDLQKAQDQLDLSRELVNGVNAERDRLTERLHTTIRTNDELVTRCTTAETERNDAIVALKVFKTKVVQVAAKYATENGWCDVIDEALKELGLEMTIVKYATKVDITVYLSATLNRNSDMKQIPDPSWVADQFTGMEEVTAFIKRRLGLSGDHSSYSVDDVEYDVIEVTSNG